MSNSIYFKFKSQKEPGRISFDGTTGLSVFDVKREIILQNKLGSGTEFDLAIYNSNNEEYDDDTTIIPRSTSVTVRRLPPSKPGKGTAARYVSGNASIGSYTRADVFPKKTTEIKTKPMPSISTSTPQRKEDAEDAAIQAMFAASNEQWRETQDKLATATPIFRPNNKKLMPTNVPDRPPPTGYICYRCGEKGHWIQLCPTLSDPSFDGKLRVKRTTGIPKSFLKTVEKTYNENSGSFMVNADGEHVIAQPDNASWENYKSRTKIFTASNIYSFKPDDSTLECTLCHKLMKNPSTTPCCQEEYCEECIQTTLLEADFVCPKCGTKDILLDTIQINNDKKERIEEYINNKMRNEDISVNKKSSLTTSNIDSSQVAQLNVKSKKRPFSDDGNSTSQIHSKQNGQAMDKNQPLNSQSIKPDLPSQINGNFMSFFPDPFMLNPYMIPMNSIMTPGIYGLPQYGNYECYPLDISKYGYFPNQQKVFSKEEDSPYTRIPLNDRNTHRQKRIRQADFRELA
ncbi:hypothetical protein T552_01410 [Pneumocystis carinii B80]|uniref:DWNN domain-containing protein n=1 Tax=Pneumocystis carinii (strain B80) TaxID=1408658 RepID=A0A0W4ZK85_PNEC8|nr:hypothetical protein T552_01410 [Pneumocystis carinii B80]KTW28780.1 hypothetical protein T552_01410 [Pneumocystis carinii B80]